MFKCFNKQIKTQICILASASCFFSQESFCPYETKRRLFCKPKSQAEPPGPSQRCSFSSFWGPLISHSGFISHCLVLWLCSYGKAPKPFIEGSGAPVVSHPLSLQRQSSESHLDPEGRARLTFVSPFPQHKHSHLQLTVGLVFKCWAFQGLWLSARKNAHLTHPFCRLTIASYPPGGVS